MTAALRGMRTTLMAEPSCSRKGVHFVILTDEDGNEKEFEHIDTLEDNGTLYLAFIPAELNLEEEAEVVILKIVEEDGEELLASVDDDEENLRLYNLFMDRLEDMYDAPEEDE